MKLTAEQRDLLLHVACQNALVYSRKPQKGGDRQKFEQWSEIADLLRKYQPTDEES